MSRSLRVGVLFVLAMVASMAVASEEISPENFVAKMRECGVPDLSTATYVSVHCWRKDVEIDLPRGLDFAGDGWLLAETRNSEGQPIKGTFLVNGGDIFEMNWDRRSPGYPHVETEDVLALPTVNPPVLTGTWRKVTPLWDVRKCISFLKSLEGDPYPFITLNDGARGSMALLADGLWQQGESALAKELWTELVARIGATNNLVEAAMSQVADGQYESLYRRFRAEGDWQAYENGIRSLLERYSDGWRMELVMRELLRRIEERTGAVPPVPVATTGWTPAEQEQAVWMLDLRTVRKNPSPWLGPSALWIIPSSWRDQVPVPLDAELKIRARGVEATPFLLALADDGALTGVDYRTISDASHANCWRIEGVTFEHFDRPATRGEVALFWLLEMFPESVIKEGYSRKEGAKLKAAIRGAYQRYAGFSDEELAVQLLPAEYGSFNPSAVQFLMGRARKSAVPGLEAYLLFEPPEAQEQGYWKEVRYKNRIELATKYAAMRGNDARPFLDAMVAQLRTEARDGQIPEGVDAEADAVRLENGSGPITGEQTLSSLCERDLVRQGSEDVLCDVQLQSLSGAQRGRWLLAHAGATSNANVRMDCAHRLRIMAGGLRPTDEAEAWESLIADDREGGTRTKERISDVYLKLNERIFAPPFELRGDWRNEWVTTLRGAEWKADQLIETYGSQGREWLRARVRQRLAGMPEAELPPYPDASPLNAKIGDALRGRFMGVENRDAAEEAMAGLTLPERVALSEWLRQEPGIHAKLIQLANRIERVEIKGDVGDWGGKFQLWEGKWPSPELLMEMNRCVEKQTQEGKSVSCLLVRHGDFGGCELTVETPQSAPGLLTRSIPPSFLGWVGVVCGPDLFASARWLGGLKPTNKNHPWQPRTVDPESLQRFQRLCEEWCSGRMSACDEAFVIFQTQGGYE